MDTTPTDLGTENRPIGRTLDVIGTTWMLRVPAPTDYRGDPRART